MKSFKNPTRRSLLLTAALAAGSLGLTACGGQAAPSSKGGTAEITIAEQSKAGVSTGMLPHLADELGYFKEEGLTVKNYVSVTKGSDAISGMISGAVQVAHIGADGIVAASQGAAVIGIAANTDASIWTVVASPNVKSWADLKGKTIALGSTSDITRSVFDKLAKDAGLDPATDLQYVALGATPQRVAAVQNGQAAATVATYPSAHRVIAEGLTDLGFGVDGKVAPILMSTDIEASKAWATANPDQAAGYLRAIKKALGYVKNPKNTDDVVKRTAGLSGEPEDSIKKALEMYYLGKDAGSGLYPDDFRHVSGAFDATVDAYLELGLLKKPITEDQYMDYSFADKALKASGN